MLSKNDLETLVLIWRLPYEQRYKSTIVKQMVEQKLVKDKHNAYPIINNLCYYTAINEDKDTGKVWLTTEGELLAFTLRVLVKNSESKKEKGC